MQRTNMALQGQGCVDWRGDAVDARKHGGAKATIYLYVLAILRSCPSSANFSIVAYFHGTLHLDIVTSTTVIAYLVGAIWVFGALMNFISDAYIKRATAIFVFGPFVVLGYVLLALQAHLPSLHPLICEVNKEPNSCTTAQCSLTLLCVSLLLLAIGDGCMRVCIPLLGGDQFSNDDTKDLELKSTFLRRLKFANSLGAFVGLVFLVWVQNNLGWNIGFMVSAMIVLVGLLVAASGLPFYRMQTPNGSPLIILWKVFIASSKKRQVVVADDIELQETGTVGSTGINVESTQTEEETTTIISMLPIFVSCLLIYLPFTLLMTLTIQVGSTMDAGIGTIQTSSASLIAIPTAFHMLMQPCYVRVSLSLPLRRFTDYARGITPLQRIGAGSVCGTAAACIATLVETKRLTVITERHGLISVGAATASVVPMSVFWLVMQFLLLSVMELASFGGLVEFITSEAPPKLKLMAPSVQSVLAGSAAWSACAFVQFVNMATRGGGDERRGWLDGANFSRTRLDRFFLLVAAFELVALINYAFWARRYVHKKESTTVRSITTTRI